MSADVHSLVGAYAVDAVDDQERAAFELHLAECPECTDEVWPSGCHAAYVAASCRKCAPRSRHTRSGSSATCVIAVCSGGFAQKPWVPYSAHCSA